MVFRLLPGLGVVAASAATAAVYSPTVRRALRQGAVYGLAGLMIAGDAVSEWLAEPATSPAPGPGGEETQPPAAPVHDSQ